MSAARLAVVACCLLGLSATAGAQQPKIPKIGILSLDFPDNPSCIDRVRHGLDGLGYVEGRTHLLELRWAKDRLDLIPNLSADLVRLNVDVIVSASAPAAAAVKEATTAIPIVLASSFYPVEAGIIKSLAHPGGNVTGVTHFTPELMAKRVQLVKELLPRATRFAVFRASGRLQDLIVNDMDIAARRLGAKLQAIEVRGADDLSAAFDTAVSGRAQALMTTQGPFFWRLRAEFAQLALRHRLPMLSGEPTAAESGAMLFYGPDVLEGCERAARYVDRILKGAKPADLPVEQPTKIDLVINIKTAKALGVRVPQSLLLRADRIIE
ncbi:MAG TPA: ABC transporter substrate-binding protein [Sphingomicrobium sp.]|jgi:putative ABC transport system substrate-binding protein